MIHSFCKNVALLAVGEGFLLLPMAWFFHPAIYLTLAIVLIIGGYVVAAYYHKRDIHTNVYTWFVGLSVLFFVNLGILLYFSLPLAPVFWGTTLFVLHVPAVQLFRRYILGINDCCSIRK